MPTDDERRRIATGLRHVIANWTGMGWELYLPFLDVKLLGTASHPDNHHLEDSARRLADLIEPSDPTDRGIDSIYEWCRERLEGADGAEDELYMAIMRAIDEYRHPEMAEAQTVRRVDRDALLELADEMDRDGRTQRERQKAGERLFIDGLDVREYARRIREACGEVDG